jgi:hypothetical protein
MLDRAQLDRMIAALREEQRRAQLELAISPELSRPDALARLEQIAAMIRTFEWRAVERQGMEDEAMRGSFVASEN